MVIHYEEALYQVYAPFTFTWKMAVKPERESFAGSAALVEACSLLSALSARLVSVLVVDVFSPFCHTGESRVNHLYSRRLHFKDLPAGKLVNVTC